MTEAPPQPPEDLELAALFAATDADQWRELVATALRRSGRIDPDAAADSVEAVLTSTTYDGVEVKPLYTAADQLPADRIGLPGLAPFTRGSEPGGPVPTGWDVRQRHSQPDPEVTREAVMADLENGVSSLWLAVGRSCGQPGLPLGSLEHVLRDVYLDLAPVVLDAGPDTEAAAEEFLAVIAARGVLAEEVSGGLGADPIGLRARTGAEPDPALVGRLATRGLAAAPGLRAVTVDATTYHDAGGSDAEELGASIATGVAYLRELTAAGLSAEQAFGQLEFRYAASADQFLTIAKFRAARRVWSRVAQVCGVEGAAAGQRQHAVTSSAMMTRRDPWVNLLRTTLACFGAGVGGAQAVTVQPFDAALGLPDDFARRIARNTSSLLVMESHVARVIDPAGGSWYVEKLTDDLAATAWAWFTEIEAAGGILAALDSDLVANRIEATWARRSDRLAHRADPLTGVSEFPNLAEAPVLRTPFPESPIEDDASRLRALPRRRYAQDFEALRDAADAHAARSGARAQVFLATLGPAAAHTARASFAANLFQAGGLATPTSSSAGSGAGGSGAGGSGTGGTGSAGSGSGGTDAAQIAAAFAASGARVACLAASDKLYGLHAATVARSLKAAGAQQVWLAGSPGERAAEDAAAGIDGYVYVGVDALGVLRRVHGLLISG